MKKAILVVAILILLVCAVFGSLLLRERIEHERLLAEYPTGYLPEIAKYAAEFELDPYLVLSVMRCESSFRSDAVSHAGAIGLMQVMPDTGAWIAHKLNLDDVYTESMLYEPDYNVRFGCWFLRFLTDRFDGERRHIIAAYNAGHGSVEGWLDDPNYAQDGLLQEIPYPETARYVEKVEQAYDAYTSLYPDLFTDGSFESGAK